MYKGISQTGGQLRPWHRSTKSRFTRNTVQNINAPISDDKVEDEEYIYSVKPAESQAQHALHVKLPLFQVYVNNKPVDMLIDSGASVNIMFRNLSRHKQKFIPTGLDNLYL